MFGVLIESRPRPQRRRGSAMLSAIVHTAIVACAIVATRPGPEGVTAYPDPARRPDTVVFVAPLTTADRPHREGSTTIVPREPRYFPAPPIDIDLHGLERSPVDAPIPGPPVSFDGHAGPIGGTYLGPGGGWLSGDSDVYVREQVDRAVAIVATPRPAYPEMLRAAGVEGRVVVRFVVDTAGRVEPATVQVVETSHALFEQAVRDVLPRFRFVPAEAGGHRVRQLVEMPFAFTLRQVDR